MIKAFATALGFALLLAHTAYAGNAVLSGDYVEVRSNHIMAGGCTYSAEAVYDGNRAVMTWRLDGDNLADIAVVAVVLGKGNLQLGNHTRETVLYIDSRATAKQMVNLRDTFSSRYSDVFGEIRAVLVADISFDQTGDDAFKILIPGEVQVVTRTMVEADHEYSCDPQVWYGAFAGDTPVRLVQMARSSYSGADLNSKWKTVNKRSAYIGKFAISNDLASR